MNGHVAVWELPPSPDSLAQLQQVVEDLETVHHPRTDNARRLQAQSVLVPREVLTCQRLDQVRDSPNSWRLAIALASLHNALPDPVHHFGISVLESQIKYFWATFTNDETMAVRDGVLHLCGQVASPRALLTRIVGWNRFSSGILDCKTCVALWCHLETHLAGVMG